MDTSSSEESDMRVQEVHAALKNGDMISDEQLIEVVQQYCIQTNTLSAAYLSMCIVAPICGYRNHLTGVLLPHVLRPLWMTSYRKDSVIAWMQYHLSQPSPFEGMEIPGIDWIRRLTIQPDMIQNLLNEIAREQHEHGTIEIREQLLPHSKISSAQIQFCYFWDEEILTSVPIKVVFFYFGDAPSIRNFETITTAIAENDTNESIQLIVVDGSAYYDRLGKYEHWISPSTEKTQTLWIYEEKLICTVEMSIVDYHTYAINTLELIKQEQTS